ncbi:hypothetical protein KIN20_016038 [Parelaphostrongylus tenuis]|uniref:Uncharacterized protein n=1 Tax=Parelaphostrongylus tenuis TaxID=148309 RepID=A0AAD5MJE5_PARTN|nr:hypothetical protein KIN20_016038 [Parelaphostrongylus tenuis]
MHRVRLSSRQSFDLDFLESDHDRSTASVGSQDDSFELMSRPDFVQSAKISAEGFLRRTGSTSEEEPPCDISDDHEPIGDMSQSAFSGQIKTHRS